jgi:Flp pilus assembly protein TadD
MKQRIAIIPASIFIGLVLAVAGVFDVWGMENIPPIRIEHSHESNTVNPILLTAWQAYRSGDFDTASQLYSEVLRKDAQNHNAPNRDALLGMAAIAQQRLQDAIAAQYYNQLLTLDPLDPDAHAGMSSLLDATPGTESRLKLLLAQSPEAAALHFALGNFYAQQSRWGDAQQAYFSACALESDNAQFAFNLAVSLDHLGQGKLAAQHYRRALQLDRAGDTNFDRAQTQLRLDELTSHWLRQHE